jgi:hypothetical protein
MMHGLAYFKFTNIYVLTKQNLTQLAVENPKLSYL